MFVICMFIKLITYTIFCVPNISLNTVHVSLLFAFTLICLTSNSFSNFFFISQFIFMLPKFT